MDLDATHWNQFVTAHAPRSGAFLQSWEWGEFQRAVGREVRRYSDGRGAAQVVSYPIRGPFYGWDLHRGPVGNADVLRQTQDDIRTTRGIFLHIEPNDGLRTTDYRLQPARNRQPQHTLIVDLTKSEDELLAAMHEKTRYNIRLAARHGVAVERSTPDNIAKLFDEFYGLLQATAGRDRFHLHSTSYYQKMIEALAPPHELETPDHAGAKIFVARHGKDALAAAIVVFFGDSATYLHGASSDAKRNLMAPHALHWEIMRQAKERAFRFYDFWGIAPPSGAIVHTMAPANHPWTGITRFKTGFGGEVVTSPPAIEVPLRPAWYHLYRAARRIREL